MISRRVGLSYIRQARSTETFAPGLEKIAGRGWFRPLSQMGVYRANGILLFLFKTDPHPSDGGSKSLFFLDARFSQNRTFAEMIKIFGRSDVGLLGGCHFGSR
jgi:hypothetical protein